MTLYNILETPLEFRLMSVSPHLYHVQPAEGTLAPKSSVNILVRLRSQALQQLPILCRSKQEAFRIETYDAKRTMSGKQIIPIIIESVSSSAPAASPIPLGHRNHAASAPSVSGQTSQQSTKKVTSASLRLAPVLAGLAAMLIFTASDTLKTLDHKTQMWVCFFAGMITMLLQLKMDP